MAEIVFNPIIVIIFSLLLSFAIVFASIPTIVNVANLKKLYDEPGHRKSHNHNIPYLGGVAIFAGLIITTGIFANIIKTPEFSYLFIGLIILFFVGIKDDILSLAPAKKLYGEIIAAIVITVIADLRFTNLHGFFGITEIGYVPSIIISIFAMIVIINSFNLIDGIDGLASGIGIIISITFAVWFYLVGQTNYAILLTALVGSLIAFFGYNVFGTKNKIFMGDSGSLILGLVISTVIIKFNELSVVYNGPYKIHAAPAVSFGIIMIPLFDTLRVVVIRILRKKSPFHADKNHLHHRFLKMGLSHFMATLILLSLNLVSILIAIFCQSIGLVLLFLVLFIVALVFLFFTEYIIYKNKHNDILHSSDRHHVRA